MAIPWLTLLKTVPWNQVISNAPAIADGARKLWKKVGAPAPAPTVTSEPIVVSPGGDLLDALRRRVEALSAGHQAQQQELQASSELIKALADQNAELVQRVEAHRVRLRWLSGLVAVMALALIWVGWRVVQMA